MSQGTLARTNDHALQDTKQKNMWWEKYLPSGELILYVVHNIRILNDPFDNQLKKLWVIPA